MGKLIDLTGQRFGRLLVIERTDNQVSQSGNVRTMWNCQCDCGKTTVVDAYNLRKGYTNSCGCLHNEIASACFKTHGLSSTKLYNVWRGILTRCFNENNAAYKHYGGRGISVCDEWRDSFVAFYHWAISTGWKDGLSIDRVNNDAGYYPENCRWVAQKKQCNNRRTTRYVQIDNITKPLAEWCEMYGKKYKTVCNRLYSGWTPEEALGIIPKDE